MIFNEGSVEDLGYCIPSEGVYTQLELTSWREWSFSSLLNLLFLSPLVTLTWPGFSLSVSLNKAGVLSCSTV